MSCDTADGCAIACVGCGLSWCRDEHISPGEAQGICRDCFDIERDDNGGNDE